MIGGVVTKIIPEGDRLRIHCEELNSTSRCGVFVKRTPEAEKIAAGDQVWWQGGNVYWTAHSAGKKDVPVPKVGFSFRI